MSGGLGFLQVLVLSFPLLASSTSRVRAVARAVPIQTSQMCLQTQLHSDTAGVTRKVTCSSLCHAENQQLLVQRDGLCRMKSWLHAERQPCLSAPSRPALINSANYTNGKIALKFCQCFGSLVFCTP